MIISAKAVSNVYAMNLTLYTLSNLYLHLLHRYKTIYFDKILYYSTSMSKAMIVLAKSVQTTSSIGLTINKVFQTPTTAVLYYCNAL